MAHYDVFREQLGIKYPACGHALWEPSPGKLYHDRPVEVGDVGYIRGGKFHRLFNALLPADHPSHSTFGVPEYHEPLNPGLPEHIDVGVVEPTHYLSPGVSRAPAEPKVHAAACQPGELPRISYLCRRRQSGAALFLPIQAERQDTVARGDFGRWIIKHIDRWFAFARRLGLGIEQMEDIVLVTGFHRARSWANAAFLEGQEEAQVSFGADVVDADGPDVDVRWQFAPEHIRGAVWGRGPGGQNLPSNQCVFLRGFRVTRILRIFPKRLVAAAGPFSDLDEYDYESDMVLTSIPAITKDRDLLHILMDHIAERIPDCDMILVHDDDLARIDGIHDRDEILQSSAVTHLTHLLEKSQPNIEEVVYDSGKYNPKTGFTVAMFSKEFGLWGKA